MMEYYKTYLVRKVRKITLDMEESEVKRIQKLAEDNDRSFSAQIRVMLKHE